MESSAAQEDLDLLVLPSPTREEEADDNDHEASVEVPVRRSTRLRTAPEWYGNPIMNVLLLDNEEPTNYEEAMMSPNTRKWQDAMNSEMESMKENQVWTLVDLPDSRKAVECKWIFKKKTDVDGNVTVYKARLVAKGF